MTTEETAVSGVKGDILTVTELLARVTALGALGFLNVIRRTSTATTQSVRLIVAFTKT